MKYLDVISFFGSLLFTTDFWIFALGALLSPFSVKELRKEFGMTLEIHRVRVYGDRCA